MANNEQESRKMKVDCPTCKTSVEWTSASEFRPFCSKRCQLIDLGQWANEENAIPSGPNNQEQLASSVDIEDVEAMLIEQEQDFFKPN